MKTVHMNEYGTSDVLKVVEVDRPVLGDNQILVDVKAIGVNPYDWKVRSGMFADFVPLTFPHVLGSEVAGVVAKVPDGYTRFKVGDRVYGKVMGAFAEQVALDDEWAHPVPEFLSFEEAASLPTSTQTAFNALVTLGNLTQGQKVLIHAGSGNVGIAAIQIAKHIGAHVTTTTSTRNVDLVKRLGADEVIDYKKSDLADVEPQFDLIIDSLGGDVQVKSWNLLKDDGRLITLVEDRSADFTGDRKNKSFVFAVDVEDNRSADLHRLIEDKTIKPVVDEVFAFEDVAKALDKSETGRAVGKIILRV